VGAPLLAGSAGPITNFSIRGAERTTKTSSGAMPPRVRRDLGEAFVGGDRDDGVAKVSRSQSRISRQSRPASPNFASKSSGQTSWWSKR
jgi:hypothetical protein